MFCSGVSVRRRAVSEAGSGFLSPLSALAREGVDFVVVGVGGLNFYAEDASEAVETLDVDVLLRPEPATVRAALAVLHGLGFTFSAAGEPFVDLDADEAHAALVRQQATLTAQDVHGTRVDLMLAMAGTRFDELASDAVEFRLGDVPVRVGRLERLLSAKEAAGRPKDREFLRMFRARFERKRPRGHKRPHR